MRHYEPAREITPMGSYHERTCVRSYGAFLRACEDGRWLDAALFATTALAYYDIGHGGELPMGAITHMAETLDGIAAGDGVTVSLAR